MKLDFASPPRPILEEEPAEDVEGLKKQLLACRAALRLQIQRSHQLAAACNAKLQLTNMKLKEAEEFSQKRFAYLARAVMGAEASLRRKQREIITQLAVRDEMILEQKHALKRLSVEPAVTTTSNNAKSAPPMAAPRKPLALLSNKPPTPYKPPGLTLSLPPQYKLTKTVLEQCPEEQNNKEAPLEKPPSPPMIINEAMVSAPSSAEVSTESSELQLTSPSPDVPMTDSLHDNFEEFHLDSENNSDENDEGILNRKSGDGAEKAAKVASCSVQGSYEGFLEATGLSQKSILTPSRLNSHRTVLRPRDIKYRSKANRTFCNGAVKYWSGPYL